MPIQNRGTWGRMLRALSSLFFNISRMKISPACPGAWFTPSCRTLHTPLLKSVRFQFSHFFNLLMSLWMTAWPSGAATTPPNFVSSANLLRVHPVPVSRLLMKKSNSICHGTDPWLVTGLRLDFVLLITTCYVHQLSQFSVHLAVHLSRPYLISLPMKTLWETMTEVFLKLR